MHDGRMVPSDTGKLVLPKGKFIVSVVNESGIPALFVQGNTIATNRSWNVTSGNWNWKTPGRFLPEPQREPLRTAAGDARF